MIHAAQQILTGLCIMALIAIGAVSFFWAVLYHVVRTPRRKGETSQSLARAAKAMLVAGGVAACVLHGGGKAKITLDSAYIRDAGSYIDSTNNVVHVAIAKAVAAVPDSTPIWVYYRELASTNADWVRIEPVYTLAEHPRDYAMANATNYNYLVVADFVPAPTVHTNGVWQMRGFWIPLAGPDSVRKAAFPNTRRKEVK